MSATRPLLVARGSLPDRPRYSIGVDPGRALATCLKPADEGPGVILRLREVGGISEWVPISVSGFTRGTVRTDLLERDRRNVGWIDGRTVAPLRAHGYCAVRLVP